MITLLTILYIQIHLSLTGLVAPQDSLPEAEAPEVEYFSPVEISELIQQGVDSLLIPLYFTDKPVRPYVYQEFAEFYHSRDYQLAWHSDSGPLPQADSLLAFLERAPEEGLSQTFLSERLTRLQRKAFKRNPNRNDWKRIAQLDFLMTSAYLTYASQLLAGRIDPAQFDSTWRVEPRRQDLSQTLEAALAANRINESLTELIPKHSQYAQLKAALRTYQQIAGNGGWPSLPTGVTLQPGDTNEFVVLLRERLNISGDLEPASLQPEHPEVYDSLLVEAVRDFQRRIGLDAHGTVNRGTVNALNVPVEDRLGQLRINLERIRWWPESYDGRWVVVNIPEYMLRIIEDGETVREMKVIVGEEYNSTPVFRDSIEYLEVNPTWTVPLSIARNEILPILRKDPGYLASQGFKLYDGWNPRTARELNPYRVNWAAIEPEEFSYRLVQQPGKHNPLGSVKFMFPNDLQVYMHDTPEGDLFNQSRRTYSHGCIRVEEPIELAVYLLTSPGQPHWTTAEVQKQISRKKPVTLQLSEQIPVQFIYQTAFVDDAGKLNFREDIYRHDREQIAALE